MATNRTVESRGRAILDRFQSYGFWGGLILGLVVGVLISGPKFRDWPLSTLLMVIAACGIAGAAIGFFAGPMAMGSTAGASGIGGGIGGSDGSDGGDGGGGGGD